MRWRFGSADWANFRERLDKMEEVTGMNVDGVNKQITDIIKKTAETTIGRTKECLRGRAQNPWWNVNIKTERG